VCVAPAQQNNLSTIWQLIATACPIDTSAELTVVLKKNSEKTLAFSLIAFDPEAPVSDPVVVEALDVLKRQWPTYVNTFEGVPILESLDLCFSTLW
jgi:hypothetical protein